MIKWDHARVIKTYDKKHNTTGSVIELFKNEKKQTQVYITTIAPRTFKGYHYHTIRTNKFCCIKGTVIIHYKIDNKRDMITLVSSSLERVIIPPHVYIGIENPTPSEAWLLNYPDPPYDPLQKGEQLSYNREEVEKDG